MRPLEKEIILKVTGTRRIPASCRRWLYVLLTERNLVNNKVTEYEIQQSS